MNHGNLHAVGSVVAWVTLNICLQFYNKYLFSVEGFKFPVLVIICGLSSTFIGTSLIIHVLHKATLNISSLQSHWKLLILLALLHGLGTALENISITRISISLNQIIKATGPTYSLILSYLIDKQRYSLSLIISTIVVIVGACISVAKNPEFEIVGVLTAVISTIFNGAQSIVMGRLLADPSLDSISIAYATALPSIAALMPVFMIFEMRDLLHHGHVSGAGKIAMTVTFISLLAFLYNLSHFWLVKYTSPHSSMIVGNFKVILLIFLSMLIFHTPFLPINLVGMGITALGFTAYTFFKYRQINARTRMYSQQPQHDGIPLEETKHDDEEEEE